MRWILEAGCPCGFLASLFLSPILLAVPEDAYYTKESSDWHGTGQGWTYTVNYTDIRKYADRPDERTLNKLAIEWQKPEVDAVGSCIIRGQVWMNDSDHKRAKPINWFQGVIVYLGTTADAKPDWSRGMSDTDTLQGTAVTTPSGRFEAHIDMRDSKHGRVHVQSFQLGLALASHVVGAKTSHKVVWNSRTAPIPSSVQMLSIPAPPASRRELQFIDRASRWPFANPNGVDLIRAANALQPLGKERALAALERYLELTWNRRYFFGDQEIVFWIIRVLFEPVRLGDHIPAPMIAVFLDDREVPNAVKWPLNPMAVYGDVPFMVGRRINSSGVPEPPASHIHWARLHGAIRDEPLHPTRNPLAAAEAILSSPRFKVLDKFSSDHATQTVRSQALAMVKGLVQLGKDETVDDDGWRSRLKTAGETDIRWDEKRQAFVRGRNLKLSATFWEDLGAANAKIAEAAVWHGAAAGDAAVARLELKIAPAAAVDAEKVAALVRRLDSSDFAERAKANAALVRLGTDAEAALSGALAKAGTLEAQRRIDGILTQQEARHRHLAHAVEVLEMIGTPAARRLLANLAKGANASRLTRAAKAALDRLETTP